MKRIPICGFIMILFLGWRGIAYGEDLPDLVVTEVKWSPAKPVIGDAVTFSATIKNQGTAGTEEGIDIAFLVDSTLVSWSHNKGISFRPGDTRILVANGGPAQASTWVASAGTHIIAAWVDDSDRIAESDETNNMFTTNLTSSTSIGSTETSSSAPAQVPAKTLSPQPAATKPKNPKPSEDLPDLTVIEIQWTPADPVVGNAVTFSATIRNEGTGNTPVNTVISVAFSVDGTLVSRSSNLSPFLLPGGISIQPANEGPNGVATWTATVGNHTVEAWVDDSDRIAESDETNNKLISEFMVTDAKPAKDQKSKTQEPVDGGLNAAPKKENVPVNNLPDLVITSISWSPSQPVAGDAVTFTANVRNQGTADTPMGSLVTIAFSVDGTLVNWSGNLAPHLTPGSFSTQTANGGPNDSISWAATAGEHTVEAFADDGNLIPESDETNNKKTIKLVVREAKPAPTPAP